MKIIKCWISELKGIKYPLLTIHNIKKIKKYMSLSKVKIKNPKTWKKIFYKFILAQPNDIEIIEAFYFDEINIKKTSKLIKHQEPILICLVKNDLYRIKKLIKHYRFLGVEKFAIIDNNSNDGTYEYLIKQPDVDLFICKEKYTSNRREGWINRVVDYYGFDLWYLIVDSDELLIYNDCEQKKIQELISYLKNNNQTRLCSILIDMYSNNSIFSLEDNKYSSLKYFDKNSYTEIEQKEFKEVRGGPRGRLFSQKALLTKYPLYYFDKKTCQGKSHFLFPYLPNHVPLNAGLLHFKFLTTDLTKYKQIAKNGNYYQGSIQYQEYMNEFEKNHSISFYSKDDSYEYENSNSIYIIPILKKVKWYD